MAAASSVFRLHFHRRRALTFSQVHVGSAGKRYARLVKTDGQTSRSSRTRYQRRRRAYARPRNTVSTDLHHARRFLKLCTEKG